MPTLTHKHKQLQHSINEISGQQLAQEEKRGHYSLLPGLTLGTMRVTMQATMMLPDQMEGKGKFRHEMD